MKCCWCSMAPRARNALAQVKAFDDALGLTGLIMTKLDGGAKGGVICAIAKERPIALRFIGVGEGIDDLQPFVARFRRGAGLAPSVEQTAQPLAGWRAGVTGRIGGDPLRHFGVIARVFGQQPFGARLHQRLRRLAERHATLVAQHRR